MATVVEWRDKFDVESEEHVQWLRTLASKKTGSGKGVKSTMIGNPFQLKIPDELDEAYVSIMVKFAEHTILSNFKNGKKKEKKTREPTAYNLFMKETMTKLKEENPELEAKERFSKAAELWNEHKTAVALTEATTASENVTVKTKKKKVTKKKAVASTSSE
jgi:hypothetical protein